MLAGHVTLRHADPASADLKCFRYYSLACSGEEVFFLFAARCQCLARSGEGMIVRSAEAPAFFCRPMLCRAVPKLIGPFYFYQFRCRDSARLCWPSDGRAASFDPILSVDPSSSPPSLLYTLPIPFDTVNICATRFLIAILCSPLFPCGTSCLRICCLL